jgi:hypothetical protein
MASPATSQPDPQPSPALLSAHTPLAIRDALVGIERAEFERRYAHERNWFDARGQANSKWRVRLPHQGMVVMHGAVLQSATLFAATRTLDSGPLALQLPDPTTLRPVPLAIGLVAAVLLLAARWPVLRVLGIAAVLGLAAGLIGLPVS